ncbi:protealysin inhibitor emfourin [Paludisphaera rhizosphaerae]|uniref:protealysin inhibitor emfourin n=1 Tax=Paludisphaera rhizosphaerae TaxID=2711216 RepID=UPI0013ED0AD7|nr:protealysin inhibitor emfourin [Paludisphaera rhizosphaerae]
MKIILQTHGGLAAGIRRPPIEVDSADLSKADAAALAEHVAAACRAGRPPGETPGPARDAMSYTLRVEEPGAAARELTQSDTSMTPEFGTLIDWLHRRAGR